MRVLLIAASCLLFLTACGQKGPLYLPQDPQAENPPAKAAQRQQITDDSSDH